MVLLPKIGDRASRTKTIEDKDIRQFAEVSGDTNSVHLDDEAAAKSVFGRRVAHGMLTASLISAVLGNELPGVGSIYMGQELRFKAPVFIGDTITASVEVTNIREDKGIITLRTICTNQDGKIVVDGEATVLAPRE
ncbi:MAG: MaoC family dehydratase [Anaerolineae bacterium]|nr:MaoC family dehydratase [Anaerolineae bacterium]